MCEKLIVFIWFSVPLEQIGAGFGILMVVILWFGMPIFSKLLTLDSDVFESIALSIQVCHVLSLFNFHGYKSNCH
jgi:hypothetical protein